MMEKELKRTEAIIDSMTRAERGAPGLEHDHRLFARHALCDLGERASERDARFHEDRAVPRVTFTDPQVAATGKTLVQAKEAGINASFQNSSIRIADPARPGVAGC